MKRKIILSFWLFLLFSCEKKELEAEKDPQFSFPTKLPKNEIYYTKNLTNIAFLRREDVGKSIKELPKENYIRLGLANKVTLMDVEYENAEEIFLVETENSKKVWMEQKDLVMGVLVITQRDTPTYELPDPDTTTQQNVQIGDLGYLLNQYQDYAYVDFRAYRPEGDSDTKTWVGTKWIQKGTYSTEPGAVAQAMYLYFAYYHLTRGNLMDAKNNLNTAQKISQEYPFMNQTIESLLLSLFPEEQKEEEKENVDE